MAAVAGRTPDVQRDGDLLHTDADATRGEAEDDVLRGSGAERDAAEVAHKRQAGERADGPVAGHGVLLGHGGAREDQGAVEGQRGSQDGARKHGTAKRASLWGSWPQMSVSQMCSGSYTQFDG